MAALTWRYTTHTYGCRGWMVKVAGVNLGYTNLRTVKSGFASSLWSGTLVKVRIFFLFRKQPFKKFPSSFKSCHHICTAPCLTYRPVSDTTMEKRCFVVILNGITLENQWNKNLITHFALKGHISIVHPLHTFLIIMTLPWICKMSSFWLIRSLNTDKV